MVEGKLAYRFALPFRRFLTGFFLDLVGFFLDLVGFFLDLVGFFLDLAGFFLDLAGFFPDLELEGRFGRPDRFVRPFLEFGFALERPWGAADLRRVLRILCPPLARGTRAMSPSSSTK